MSETFERIKVLVVEGQVRISEHGDDELADDDLTARELLASVTDADLVEDYPDYGKGPCVLLL